MWNIKHKATQNKSKCEKKNTTWGCKCKTKASVRRRTLRGDANARQKQVWEEEHYVGMQMQDKSKCEKKNTMWGCKCKNEELKVAWEGKIAIVST